ncbi:hypothetical protein B0H10DRAFT_869279 [Mycena sp. CBHHK59/15]|nr:hypothetical protein B0H10DRAFT_869279 [Mycena sp. CBHHK59/15]
MFLRAHTPAVRQRTLAPCPPGPLAPVLHLTHPQLHTPTASHHPRSLVPVPRLKHHPARTPAAPLLTHHRACTPAAPRPTYPRARIRAAPRRHPLPASAPWFRQPPLHPRARAQARRRPCRRHPSPRLLACLRPRRAPRLFSCRRPYTPLPPPPLRTPAQRRPPRRARRRRSESSSGSTGSGCLRDAGLSDHSGVGDTVGVSCSPVTVLPGVQTCSGDLKPVLCCGNLQGSTGLDYSSTTLTTRNFLGQMTFRTSGMKEK